MLRYDSYSDSNSLSAAHKENQDSYISEGTLFAVADGVGGYAGAKEASSTAIKELKARSSKIIDEESMRSVLKEIHLELQKVAHKNGILNMGTTIAVAKVFPDSNASGGRVITGNAGDSPILYFSQKGIERVFVDDSHRGENPYDIFGIVQYLGLDAELEAHAMSFTYNSGDFLLICSDGITDNITDQRELEKLVRENSAKLIVEESIKSRRKRDDMSAIVLSF